MALAGDQLKISAVKHRKAAAVATDQTGSFHLAQRSRHAGAAHAQRLVQCTVGERDLVAVEIIKRTFLQVGAERRAGELAKPWLGSRNWRRVRRGRVD